MNVRMSSSSHRLHSKYLGLTIWQTTILEVLFRGITVGLALSPYWKWRTQVRHFEKSACSLRDLCFRLQISTLQLWFSHALSWCHWVTCVASSVWVDNHACTMRAAEHGSHFLYYNFFGPPIRHFVSTEYLLYSLIPWKTNIFARSHFVFCSVHTF